MAKKAQESVTGRILSILEAFESSNKALSIAEISSATGLPVSTTYRLVGELQSWGAISKTSDGNFQVGIRIWELGQHAGLSQREHVVRPYLQDLFDLTHENVHLAVRQGATALYVDKIYGSKKVPMVSRVGSKLPLHSTAVGRVLLAAEPQWFVKTYLDKKLVAPTTKTNLDRDSLESQLRQAQKQGYAMTVEQMRLGASSIAVPVVVEGTTIAAIGIVVESAREQELQRLLPLLKGTADRIQQALTPAKRATNISLR
ncbi:MAG: IclR family transcriptional regulator [Micrococcales bacterium]